MCRAKKLVSLIKTVESRLADEKKCSATKPACDQCSKRQDRCVYDAIRPASRVEKLEKKLAEMEEQENQNAQRRASSGPLHMPRLPYHGASSSSTPMAQPLPTPPMDYGMFPYHTSQPTIFSHSHPGHPASMTALPRLPNIPSSAPLPTWPWSSNTSQNHPGPSFSMDPLPTAPAGTTTPWALLHSTNDVSTASSFWNHNNASASPEAVFDDFRPSSSAATSSAAMTPAMTALDPNVTLLGNGYPLTNPFTSTDPSRSNSGLGIFPDNSNKQNSIGLNMTLPPIHPSQPMIPSHSSSSLSSIYQPQPHPLPPTSIFGGQNGMSSPPLSVFSLEEKDISQSARDYLYVDPWMYLDAVYSVC